MSRMPTTADAFNAVAEPRRREILDLLAAGERPVNDLVELTGLGQPQVSKHLRVLREVGAVRVRDEGRRRLYRLDPEALRPIFDWVSPYQRLWEERFEQLDDVLEDLKRKRKKMMSTDEKKATLTLPAEDQILVTREFDAPRQLVYKAWTTPELVARWWTAKRGTAKEMEIDLRVGGRWRYAMDTADGQEVAFHGEYREIIPGERLVSTEVFEGAPGTPEEAEANATVNTATFAEQGGRTTVTILIQCPSREVRDAIVASGMEDGLQDALDLLEAVAQDLED